MELKINDTSKISTVELKIKELLKESLVNYESQSSQAEILELVHEIEENRKELQLRIEELRLAKDKADIVSYKYSELYDIAPSGLFTLSKEGFINEANLSGSQMLGKARTDILGSKLELYFTDETRPFFHHLLTEIFLNKTKLSCEVILRSNDEERIWVFISGLYTGNDEECVVSLVDSTWRKNADEEFRNREERFRSVILQTAIDGFLLVDMQGRLLEVNETYCRMSGYSEKELLSMQLSELEAVESVDDIITHVKKIILSGDDRFESKHRRKDGSIFDIEISIHYYHEEQRFVVFLQDISNRKQTQELIYRSEEKFRHLVLDMQVGVLLQGPQAEILLSNPLALELLGLTEEQLLGKTSFDPEWNVIHEDGSPFPGPTHPVPQAIETRLPVRDVVMGVYRPGTGDRVWLLVYAQPQLNADGTIRQVVCTFIDITKRKQVEDALKENEQLLSETQKIAHIGSYTTDLKSLTWKVTPEIYQIFGVDETYPHTFEAWIKIVHPDFQNHVLEYILQMAAEKKSLNREYKIVRIDNDEERWIHALGVFEYDTQMNPVKIIGTIQDITLNKQNEAKLKQLNEELEDRVKERSIELVTINNALQQTEEKYRTVADYTYNWEYWVGTNGDIQYMSPSVERITGYTVDDFLTFPNLINEIVFRDDQELWDEHRIKSHNSASYEIQDEIEFRIVSKTGEIRWIDHICRRIFSEGKYLGIRVSNRDITDKVKTENDLLSVTVRVEEQERNRFSNELHDGLGPLLSTVKLYFQWLSETDNPKKIQVITEKGNNNIERAILTTREIAHGLNSQFLIKQGYTRAVLHFCKNINYTQKINIKFNYNSKIRFSNLLEITLYRITTELINNTLKYADATQVEIDFNFNTEKNRITFTYTDNGLGFDTADVENNSKGQGLLNIIQRIKIIKGKIQFESGIGKGFNAYIELPVTESNT